MSETERFKEAAEKEYPYVSDATENIANAHSRYVFQQGASHGYTRGREDERANGKELFDSAMDDIRYWKERAEAAERRLAEVEKEHTQTLARVKELEGAVRFAHMTLEHAQHLGYLGEGSTKGMADEAIEKCSQALGRQG